MNQRWSLLGASVLVLASANAGAGTCLINLTEGPSLRRELDFNEFRSIQQASRQSGIRVLPERIGLSAVRLNQTVYNYDTSCKTTYCSSVPSKISEAVESEEYRRVLSGFRALYGKKAMQAMETVRVLAVGSAIEQISRLEESRGALSEVLARTHDDGAKEAIQRNLQKIDALIAEYDQLKPISTATFASFSIRSGVLDDATLKAALSAAANNELTKTSRLVLDILGSESFEKIEVYPDALTPAETIQMGYQQMRSDVVAPKGSQALWLMGLVSIPAGLSNADSSEKMNRQALHDFGTYKVLQQRLSQKRCK